MRNRANTCSTLRADSLCVIFVADFFTVYFKPLQGNTNGDIYHDIRKLLQERNFANAFLTSFDAEATSFFTEQHVGLQPGLSEHIYF